MSFCNDSDFVRSYLEGWINNAPTSSEKNARSLTSRYLLEADITINNGQLHIKSDLLFKSEQGALSFPEQLTVDGNLSFVLCSNNIKLPETLRVSKSFDLRSCSGTINMPHFLEAKSSACFGSCQSIVSLSKRISTPSLHVDNCRALKHIPILERATSCVIFECNALEWVFSDLSLKTFEIQNCESFKGFYSRIKISEELKISDCKEFFHLPEGFCANSLTIVRCPSIRFLPNFGQVAKKTTLLDCSSLKHTSGFLTSASSRDERPVPKACTESMPLMEGPFFECSTFHSTWTRYDCESEDSCGDFSFSSNSARLGYVFDGVGHNYKEAWQREGRKRLAEKLNSFNSKLYQDPSLLCGSDRAMIALNKLSGAISNMRMEGTISLAWLEVNGSQDILRTFNVGDSSIFLLSRG